MTSWSLRQEPVQSIRRLRGVDLENVFFMRTPEDAIALRNLISDGGIKRAVVVGAGYIGLEIAENLAKME